MTPENKKTYTMKHWMLVKGSDGIAVQGHLHDRVGFPEGVEVVTSGIVGWNHKGTELLLETENSVYKADLYEYITESNSIFFLAEDDDENTRKQWKSLSEVYGRIRDEKEDDYQSFFHEKNEKKGVLMCWQGCDMPYMSRTVDFSQQTVTVHDMVRTWNEAAARVETGDGCFSVNGSVHPPLISQNTTNRGGDGSLFIRNEGSVDLFFMLQNGVRTRVKANETVRVK